MTSRGSAGSVLLAALIAGAAALSAQPWRGTGDVGVEVEGRRGKPVAGAVVALVYRDLAGVGGPAPRLTDERGRASFDGLAPGSWNLEVSHPEHLSFVAAVLIQPNKKPEVTASFLQATGSGRETLRVKISKGGGRSYGTPAPPSAEPPPPPPAAPPAEPNAPEARPEPPPARPAPTPAPPVEAPAEPAPPVEAPAPAKPAAPPPTPTPEPAVAPAPKPAPEPPKVPVAEPAPPARPEPEAPKAAAPEPAPPPRPTPEPPKVPAPEPAPAPKPAPEPPKVAAPEPAPPAKPALEPPKVAAPEPTPPAQPALEPPKVAAPEPTPPAKTALEPPKVAAPEPTPPAKTAPEMPTAAAPEPVPAPKPTPKPPTVPVPEPAPPPVAAPEPSPAPAVPPAPPEPTPPPIPAPRPPAEPPPKEVIPPPTPEPAPKVIPPPAPEPAVAPPSPAPSPAAAPLPIRSFRDGSCSECKPGEWAVSAEATVAAGGAGGCDPGTVEALRPTIARLADEPATGLSSFAGPALDAGGSAGGTSALDLVGPELAGEIADGVGAHLEAGSPCRLVAVSLPRGARFAGFRYEAFDGTGGGDCQAQQDCPLGAARWPSYPIIERGRVSTVVYAVFENRAPDRERRARLTVYFVPASGAWRPPS